MISLFKQKTDRNTIIQGDGFEATLLRTNRKKSASIKVKDGLVTITTPKWAAIADIESLIAKKADWIKTQLQHQEVAKQFLKRNYNEGDKLFFRGQQVTLCFRNEPGGGVLLNGEQLFLPKTIERSSENIKMVISAHFKKLAERHLIERTQTYAKAIGVTYSEIKVKSYKSRWGSCSTKGLISYNWRIIIAPDAIIDYIVIHELCHLIEHNHSPRFWALVAQFSPNYKQHRTWLREKGLLLAI